MHLSGLMGMPRRVYTYPSMLGWDLMNMLSTIGAFMLASGVVVFLVDLIRNLRPTLDDNAGNVWESGTLEWIANGTYGIRSIPHIVSREPLWDQPGLREAVDAGRWYLPNAPTGGRETIVTSPIEAMPQQVLRLPGPGWPPLLAAVFTAAFFMLLTVKLVTLAAICGFSAIAMILVWMWSSDPAPVAPVEIGDGIKLPVYVTGPASHSWWAMVVLLLVAGSLYLSFVFSYLYLWTVSPQVWPRPGVLPALSSPVVSAALLALSSAVVWFAGRTLPARSRSGIPFMALLVLAVCALVAALGNETFAHWSTGLRPDADAHAAMVYLSVFLQTQLAVPLIIWTGFLIARRIGGRLGPLHRVTFDNLALLWHYTVAQSLLGLLLVHGFPRLIA
jgi:cytochrome c oxidase subunit I+III